MRSKVCALAVAALLACTPSAWGGAFINEIHYDNAGGDVDEFIEVVLDGGTDPATVEVWLYNGSDGELYTFLCTPTAGTDWFNVATDFTFHGTMGDGKDYYSVLPPSIQNGGPDGIAISIGGALAEFVSYEGSFTATCEVANGATSTDIGAAETSSTPIGSSLQRIAFGGIWVLTEGTNTRGGVNVGDPTGACCDLGNCSVTTAADCTGEYQGDGTVCDPNPCDQPIGACCDDSTGICTDGVTEADCLDSGGRYGGNDSTCGTIDPPCVPPIVGACCYAGFCADGAQEADCVAGGGTYQGDDSDCTLVSCPAGGLVAINEIRIDQPSTDLDEYFELAGDPGTSLDGLTFVTIGDSSSGPSQPAGRSGSIETALPLTGYSLPADGHFLAVEENNWSEDLAPFSEVDLMVMSNAINFENGDNVSHLLVAGFTGAPGDLLDTDRDGFLDVTPWAGIVDAISIIEKPNGPGHTPPGGNYDEWDYGFGGGVGPDGNYVPGHVYRCYPGINGDWAIGAFNEAGGDDTAGAPNLMCPLPLDIKPGSCPNPLNIHAYVGDDDDDDDGDDDDDDGDDDDDDDDGAQGKIKVALVGKWNFDITVVDVMTLLISRADGVGGSVAPLMGNQEPCPEGDDDDDGGWPGFGDDDDDDDCQVKLSDVATPFEGELCECHDLEEDGIVDLKMKFRRLDLVEILELAEFQSGDSVELVLTGLLLNGLAFEASDCIEIIAPPAHNSGAGEPTSASGGGRGWRVQPRNFDPDAQPGASRSSGGRAR